MLPIKSNLIEAHVFRIRKMKVEFLLLKRSQQEIFPGLWQMVSGVIMKGETAYAAALREIIEETGLKPQKLWAAPNVNSFYSKEDNCISFLPVFAAQVHSNSKVILSNEHTEFKWVSKEKAKKLLAWEGQKKSVEIIHEYFCKHNNYINFIEIKF